MMNRRTLTIGTGLAVMNAALPSLALSSFASRPIEIVVPYAAGGPADRYVRAMMNRLGEAWGQPVVISNKPGGGATIGTVTVARAVPDGHTLLMASFGLIGNQLLMRDLPYDPKALTPISLAGVGGMTLYTRRSLKVETLEQFLAVARSQVGGLRFGSSGVGSTPHIACEALRGADGVGSDPRALSRIGLALTDLLASNIDAVFTATAGGPASSAALVAIASSGTRRSLLTPEVPTLTEAGLNVVARTWYGFLAPSGTPAAIRTQLAQAFQSLASNAEARSALTAPFKTWKSGRAAPIWVSWRSPDLG
ncbi:Bug family tripartite tricarboxylate transporter substrate binding protein [Pseudoroseomonas wenyumeiae]